VKGSTSFLGKEIDRMFSVCDCGVDLNTFLGWKLNEELYLDARERISGKPISMKRAMSLVC
jgi:hypothetical protein